MVLVAVGDEDRLQPVGAGLDPGRIGHDQIDAGRRLHVREGHADIDEDEAFRVLRPEAVEIHVHADLARAAEREIDQPVGLAGAHRAGLRLRKGAISHAKFRVSL